MKVTSAQASKMLRQLADELSTLKSLEQNTYSFVAATSEDIESARPEYDYSDTQEKIIALESKIREAEAEEAKVDILREFQQQVEKEQKQEENIKLQKERLEQKITEANEAYERAKVVYIEYQNAIRTAGTLTSDIEKSHSVYEIMDIACKIIGLLIGDSSFHERQLKKFSEECKEKVGSGEIR